jgi:uncharacterized protein (UPF0332 family)
MDKLAWCFKIKDGLKRTDPNERLALSYLEEAKSSLKRAEASLTDGDLLWATVILYYAEYYSLCSFLQRVGLKCENHACSILAVGKLIGEEAVETINRHKDMRIDAQYFMRIGKEAEIGNMLQDAKFFVAHFDELVSNIGDADVEGYRRRL